MKLLKIVLVVVSIALMACDTYDYLGSQCSIQYPDICCDCAADPNCTLEQWESLKCDSYRDGGADGRIPADPTEGTGVGDDGGSDGGDSGGKGGNDGG